MDLGRLWILLTIGGSLAAQSVNYTYDAVGRLTGVSYPNGTSITYTYDPAGNLLSRQVTTSGSASPANRKEKTKTKKASTAKGTEPAADKSASSEGRE